MRGTNEATIGIDKISAHSAQMITTALNVGSNGSIALGNGPTYGILVAILFTHGIVCSAGTAILARLNLFYVLVNGECHAGLP